MFNNEKSKQLGMSFGTASARLKKDIMFKLLQKLNENVCFRCKKTIEHSKDLSIDHKENWMYISVDLFWDLNNIAFSHTKCNRPQRQYNRYSKAPKGTAWCGGCKEYVSTEQFAKRNGVVKGYQSYCYSCRKKKFGWN